MTDPEGVPRQAYESNVWGTEDSNWTFAGSLRGADRAAIMLTMITTCRLNDVDPKAWLADIIADRPASRLHELLPWEWKLLRQGDTPADQQAA
ncbi:hypothetical protein ABIB80_004523 [Bradyrhizobium sp. i1.15.2]